MIKEEIVRAVAKHAGITNVLAERVLDAFSGVTTNNLAAGQETSLPGLGKLSVVTREARIGRNPRTGETVPVPKTTVVKFKPSSALREAVK